MSRYCPSPQLYHPERQPGSYGGFVPANIHTRGYKIFPCSLFMNYLWTTFPLLSIIKIIHIAFVRYCMNKSNLRNPGLDIIRCIALLCVISVHFFLNTGFYDQTVAGEYMLVMVIMRNSFMICVPLFMMLTGYLTQSKETSKAYYLKIVRILYVYLIASLFCGFYKIYFCDDSYSVPITLARILSFQTAPYSWYVEMYIGLFLLIPFLNTMYSGLQTQRNKQLLILTLLLLTALPSVLNIYNISRISDPEWWRMPSKSAQLFPLVPDWWSEIYPITYFFLGKYLREYPIQYRPKQLAVTSILVFLLAGIFNYYRSYGNTFIWGTWQDYGSFLITLQTVLIFSFFIKLKYDKLPSVIGSVLAKISDLSFGAYLTSWIFDTIVYPRLNDSVQTIQQKLFYFPLTVIAVLIGSITCSFVIDLSYSLINKKIIRRFTKQGIGD